MWVLMRVVGVKSVFLFMVTFGGLIFFFVSLIRFWREDGVLEGVVYRGVFRCLSYVF